MPILEQTMSAEVEWRTAVDAKVGTQQPMWSQSPAQDDAIAAPHVPNTFVLDAGVGVQLESYICATDSSLVRICKEGESSAAKHGGGETGPVYREGRSVDRSKLGAVNILSSQCHTRACPDPIRRFAVDLDRGVQKFEAPVSAKCLDDILRGRAPVHMAQVLAISYCEVAIDAVGEPSARAPIHDALDTIRVRLESLGVRKTVGIKDAGRGRMDNPGLHGKPAKAGVVAPVVGSIL